MHNNPSELALQEVKRLWPSATKYCLVSVGTGRQQSIKVVETPTKGGIMAGVMAFVPGGKTATGVAALKKIAEACVKLTTSSEQVHQRVLRRCADEAGCKYYRFQVERGMDDIGLEEWEKMDEMGDHTRRYMDEGEGERKRDECVESLMNCGGTTGQAPRLRP